MPSSFFSGLFAAETENPAELNTRSFAGTMLRLFPNGSFPLWGLLSQQSKARAVSSTHGYFSKTLQFGAVTVNGAIADGVTTAFVVISNASLAVGHVLYNPTTRENLRVTAVNANGTGLTLSRAFGRVAGAAVADTQVLLVIGSAFMQGSDRPTNRGITKIYVPNYTQIFRNAWALTDTARASAVEKGISNISENKQDCAILHSVECESAIVFGQPKMDTTGSEPLHATQGIYDATAQYAAANVATAAGTTDYDQLVELVDPTFAYSTDMGNPNERLVLCGNTAMKVLHKIGRLFGVINRDQQTNSFGMRFTQMVTYRGTLNLMTHPLFNAYSSLAKLALIIDLAAVKLAFLEGRDTKDESYGGPTGTNANGKDSQGGSLTSEFAVELINPAACGVVEGLTAAAA